MEVRIKELIKGYCTFESFQDGCFYYRTENGEISFPVPLKDNETMVFRDRVKGLLFLRYIRSFIDSLEGMNNLIGPNSPHVIKIID